LLRVCEGKVKNMRKYLLISLIVLSGFDKALIADMDTDGIVEHYITGNIKSLLHVLSRMSLLEEKGLIQQKIYDNVNIFNNIQDLCNGTQQSYQRDNIKKAIKKTGIKLNDKVNSIKLLEDKPLDEFILYKFNQANTLINKEIVDLKNNIRWFTKENCPMLRTLKKMKKEESKRRMYGE